MTVRFNRLFVLLLALCMSCTGIPAPPSTPEPAGATGAPSPSQFHTASPATTAPAPTLPSSSPAIGWRLLVEGSNLQPVWSPDGAHLLVSAERTWPDVAASVSVVSIDGAIVAQISDASRAVWIDSERFLAHRWSAKPYLGESNHAPAFVGTIAAGTFDEIEAPYGWTVSNGFGAVAIGRSREHPDGVLRTNYVVWGGEDATEPRSGHPVSWSLHGDMLALLHPVTPTRGISGWLEVVQWPGQDTVFEDKSRAVIDEALFSPTGEHIGYADVTGKPPGPYEYSIHLVDLQISETIRITIDDHTDFRWNAAGEIVALSGHESIDRYSTDGTLIATQPIDRYWIIDASLDGSMMLFYEGEDDVVLSVGTMGSLIDVRLPDGSLKIVALSPDGDRLAAVMADPRSPDDRQQLFVYDF